MVVGPVATIWAQRVAAPAFDQFSLHTTRAAAVFNVLIDSANPGSYAARPVVP